MSNAPRIWRGARLTSYGFDGGKHLEPWLIGCRERDSLLSASGQVGNHDRIVLSRANGRRWPRHSERIGLRAYHEAVSIRPTIQARRLPYQAEVDCNRRQLVLDRDLGRLGVRRRKWTVDWLLTLCQRVSSIAMLLRSNECRTSEARERALKPISAFLKNTML